MYFGLDDENNPVTEKEVIIQINNVSENKNYVNVCIKNPKDYCHSSYIQTMPYNLVYYGDMGDFIFRGNICAEQTLFFFKKYGCFDGKVNYECFYQKLENKKDAMVYDSETFARSVMKYISEYYLDEDVYDETKSVDDNRKMIYDYLEEHDYNNDSKEHSFDDLMHYVDDGEWCISKVYDILSDDYNYNLECQTYTNLFKECCNRLSYFSGKILEMIGYEMGE